VADHGVSVKHPIAFKDGVIQLRFMLEHPKDSLGINIADLQEKSVHAGHLFRVTAAASNVEITDLKTGVMNSKNRAERKSGKVSEELTALLKTKTKRVQHKLELKKWHDFRMQVKGESVSVDINGKELVSFASEGFAHPTKRLLRIAVAREVVVDDLKVFSMVD